MNHFKRKFCWWPVRLARHVPLEGTIPPCTKMEFIGWVWWQHAELTNNMNHGWVCFLESKPQKPRCPKCNQILPEKLP